MKKLFLTFLFIFTLNTSSFAASSSDVFLRQDVFDAIIAHNLTLQGK